jgi:hypothetical protein
MPWRGPQVDGEFPSLGWALIERWAELFPSPRDDAEPFILTDSQALIVVDWYQVNPVTGQFVYRRGCSRRSKGSGKSPLEAAKCISELALDVRFDGWDAHGEPVGRPWGTRGDPHAWVQIAALSEDQDENTYSPLLHFLTANGGRLADELGIDAGKTRCLLRANAQALIEPVTSRAGSREGQPITYGSLDESGMMTPQTGGVRLATTVRRNAAKMGGRSYENTNGFVPGENSVAEATHKAVEKGAVGILYDAVEAPTEIDGVEVNLDAPDEILAAALRVSYGDAWWVDINRQVADIRDPDTPWGDSERFFFNWNRKGVGKAIDPHRWAALTDVTRVVADRERIGVGFDGSISEDCTALVGCTADGYIWPIRIWTRPINAPTDWKIPRLEVERQVEATFERWDVGRMCADPPKWQTEIERWMERWGDDVVVFFDTNQPRRMSPACDRFGTGVAIGALSHDGDSELATHIAAMSKAKARGRDPENDGRTLYVYTKSDDLRKIDAGIGAVLAYEAAMSMPTPELVMAPATATSAPTVPHAAWRPNARLKV